ncbi:MAG: hypothetical protein H6821_04785 [Planctomycetaceae bacterium]|mgnify:CR=1 FL=1|nr:hypothetical protein [Planctomycetales bacterium]MCB9873476.1 hypothetical protein [Planctomycetaceae bacterium]MCB9940386.1 hypothetical protein [Planctomycetaceae bacterium]
MSSNPYENPYQPAPGGNFAGGGGPPSGNASELVNMPATLLLVAGGLGVAAHILGILLNILGVSMMGAAPAEGGPDQTAMVAQGIGAIVGAAIGLGFDALVIVGALKMKKLESYGLAMAASIIAMLPCISCGCLLGLPIGIWSLVVLNKPEVKSAFR